MKFNLFDEVVEDVRSIKFNVQYLGFSLAVILLWVYTAIPEQRFNAMVYIVMLTIWALFHSLDFRDSKSNREGLISTSGIGKTPFQSFMIGAIIFFFIAGGLKFTIKPLSIVDPNILSFLFIVVAAPYVEANFFRGMLQGFAMSLVRDLFRVSKNIAFVGGMLIQSTVFAFFHTIIFAQAGDFFVNAAPYFLFGVVMTLLVYFFKDISIEFGSHGINNYLAWVSMVG